MVPKPKVVFDTNILISAIIFGGNPKTCLELARSGELELYTSKPLLLEFAQKLKVKFKWDDQDINDVIEAIAKFAQITKPKLKITLIKKDPPDNRVLECALEAKVDYIVSGDKKHILSLKKLKTIPTITATEFLKIYYQSKK